MSTASFACFIGVLLLYVISVLCATDVSFLGRRTNGLIQLTYSLTVGYGLFLAVTQASRRQIASLFLTFSLVILVGCLLENYAGLRPVSDAVRNVLYSKGIYENDLCDVGGVASAPQRDRRPAGDVMARTARCVSKDGDCDDQDEQRQRHKTRRMHHRTMTPAPGKSRQSPPVTDISPRSRRNRSSRCRSMVPVGLPSLASSKRFTTDTVCGPCMPSAGPGS